MQRLRPTRMRFFIITIAAVVAGVLTASLGFWQLSRAKEKIAIQTERENRAKLPPLNTGELLVLQDNVSQTHALESWLHRLAVVQGVWLADKTVYLDNRQMNGRPGFFVITPLLLANSEAVILIQRGWIPRNFQDRSQLVPVETSIKPVRIVGSLAGSPARLFEFTGAVTNEGVSRIRQNLDIAQFRQETGLPVLSLSLVQTHADEEVLDSGHATLVQDSLLRDWPVVTFGVDRNYGYAFQWFGLSSLIVLMYVWFQFIRRSRPN